MNTFLTISRSLSCIFIVLISILITVIINTGFLVKEINPIFNSIISVIIFYGSVDILMIVFRIFNNEEKNERKSES
jgi:hypothetical protein